MMRFRNALCAAAAALATAGAAVAGTYVPLVNKAGVVQPLTASDNAKIPNLGASLPVCTDSSTTLQTTGCPASGLTAHGTVTNNDCLAFYSSTQVQDNGIPCYGNAPTMRGTTGHVWTGSSQSFALPPGTVAGDLAYLVEAGGNTVGSLTGITGWTEIARPGFSSYWTGEAFTKTLTAGDITTGQVTINNASFAQVGFLTTFAGVPTIVAAGFYVPQGNSGAPPGVEFSNIVPVGFYNKNVLYLDFISMRGNGNQTVFSSGPSQIGSFQNSTNGSGGFFKWSPGSALPLFVNDHQGTTSSTPGMVDAVIGFVGP